MGTVALAGILLGPLIFAAALPVIAVATLAMVLAVPLGVGWQAAKCAAKEWRR